MAYDNVSVWFDNNDLSQIGGLSIPNHDFNQMPGRDIKMSKIARSDKSLITSAEYTNKEVKVWVFADGCNRYEAENIIAQLKAYLPLINKILKVRQYDTLVEYTATLKGLTTKYESGHVEAELTFLCSDPIGKDASVDTIPSKTITTATDSQVFTVGGSFKVFPEITVVINAVTGGTGASITLANTTTEQAITITRDWIAGDELVVDNDAKTVRINGGFVDYTGSFIDFYAGPKSLGYTDNFTTRNVTVSGIYNKKYV